MSITNDSSPSALRALYRRIKRRLIDARNRRRSPQDVFEEIYRRNVWGGSKGEFNSGGGTESIEISRTYIETVGRILKEGNLIGTRFVDLGCGDFRVGEQICDLASDYIAIDVVESLVRRLNENHVISNVKFLHLDMVSQDLPDGEVCFLRQVLQHLSNEQIGRILPKLQKYRAVFITEHLPSDHESAVPNLDKVHGGEIRLFRGSGVFLDKPPFNLDPAKLRVILELPGHGFGGGIAEPGVIRTTLYMPGSDD